MPTLGNYRAHVLVKGMGHSVAGNPWKLYALNTHRHGNDKTSYEEIKPGKHEAVKTARRGYTYQPPTPRGCCLVMCAGGQPENEAVFTCTHTNA